jgi:ribosome-associated protein YbcJ (S4-like RNA binding protein)
MASSRLSKLALLLALVALGAAAQERVRGVISAVDGNVITVGGKKLRVGDKTEIVYTQPILLGDLKPGDFLGVTSMKGPGGQLTAVEVRRFPKPVSPGHRPFDGRDDQTMTNASVEAMVQASTGRELTMAYPGGTQKIVVPESASISTLVPGSRDQLVPGAPVNLTHDASGIALRLQVGPKR